MRIDKTAAEGFEAGASSYERARPEYPAAAIERMVRGCGLGSDSHVLDLAAGTGKLTRLLVSSGARLVAAEPVRAMRDAFTTAVPGVPLVASTAEAMPFASGSFDAVVVGQAFHWFDGDRALDDIARVLRPAGALGLIWNVRDQADPLNRALNEIINRYEVGVARFWRGEWRPPFERTTLFTPLEQTDFRHEHSLNADGVVDRMLSVSFIATQPAPERKRIEHEVREIVGSRSEVVMPYLTEVYLCNRNDSPAR